LQGDIIESGSSTSFGASHKYDAWGAVTETVLGSSTNAANFQYGYIFGYRGYQYDKETGLYYCQSRYYNPRVGRFVNSDAFEMSALSEDELLGTNLFAYCGNNAVNKIDPDGYDAIWLQYYKGAGNFGHTALLIQDKKKVWQFFSWGSNRDDGMKKLIFGISVATIPIDEILQECPNQKPLVKWKSALAKAKHHMKANWITQSKGLTHAVYIAGDFSKSIPYYEKNYEGKQYNLYTRNCVQVSLAMLMQGKFAKNNAHNQKLLAHLLNKYGIFPNNAFLQFVAGYRE